MTSHALTVPQPTPDIMAEVGALRRSLLPVFVALTPVAAWPWHASISLRYWEIGRRDLPLVLLPVVAYLSHWLAPRRHDAACWLLLLGLAASHALALPHSLSGLGHTLMLVSVIAASALLGSVQAAAYTSLVVAVDVTARWGEFSAWRQLGTALDSALPYALIAVAMWLAMRPLQASVNSALTGWAEARRALSEARERRGELHRALRALEEATYRIERMNNELVIARDEAEKARALKARFVATVGHELRSPLNVILGFSKLMALSPESYGVPLPEDYRADVVTVYRTSQHVADLIEDVLDLSQIEAQHLPLTREPIVLRDDVVAQAVEIVSPLAERKGLALHVEIPAGLPVVLADRVRLRQALLNLLTNAVRFTERGRITVRAGQREDAVEVAVEDTGTGIPTEALSRLFQEFYRVKARQQYDAGTGLGLAISKHIVELHGGRIGVTSTEGAGTCVTFTIPMVGSEPATMAQARTRGLPHRALSPVCLVVHDDPAAVRLLARHLEGYRVIGLPDESNVAKLVQEMAPRAIITNLEAAPRFEALAQQWPSLPILSCALPRVVDSPSLRGVTGYLIKPVSADAVAAMMGPVRREDREAVVLLVDDDPDALRLLERMLMALPHPYRILRARGGARALEMMEDTVPDIVFVDLAMPEVDGRQVIEQMRAWEHTRDVPVVIVSGQSWPGDHPAMGFPIRIDRREPVDLGAGVRALLAAMDEVHPSYLTRIEGG